MKRGIQIVTIGTMVFFWQNGKLRLYLYYSIADLLSEDDFPQKVRSF